MIKVKKLLKYKKLLPINKNSSTFALKLKKNKKKYYSLFYSYIYK